ncbi:family 43 glycosylhydrolase [Paraflavisolibacter sp. H34]|uniref:family 43 glycosylhydrolase n=1 Tax=Huijunlia imazamoxiresistens TaxID=3127457 RepID=UPI003018429D
MKTSLKLLFAFLSLPCSTLRAQEAKPVTPVQVKKKGQNNPALRGLFADPDIIFSEKTGRFYIYPTTDGFTNWMGTYFKAFSSADLVHWKDEGVVLDLQKEVSWADVRAWAPCIIERKINGQYKYFYYFCAEQKIGVAVGDSPAGPFVDTGKPLIDKRPDGFVRKGQQIDPDVFQDPQTGKYFLYWGNGYLAGAELNDDMVSLKPETIKELTPPDRMYTEGTHVFYRQGTYYFLWSQNDTRDPNYRVRYGMTKSPLEKLTYPQNNFVVVKDSVAGIYGTGHNATIQVPGKDEWYLVYHRFNYPNGINMGREAGYNREVCIDKMTFNADGTIQQVIPTHKGIQPVSLKPKRK